MKPVSSYIRHIAAAALGNISNIDDAPIAVRCKSSLP